MPRSRKPYAHRPNAKAAAAFGRIRETAVICAASLFGEKPPADIEDLSPEALRHAAGMMLFLTRIDSKDMAALSTGPGSFADFRYQPWPADFQAEKPLFAPVQRAQT
ncbi:MAG: hypothetical protein WBA44_06885 [Mesorhizobium sp.]